MSGSRSIYSFSNKYGFSQADHLALVKSGNDFFIRAIDIIKKSKRVIHFQTYIFIDDSTGRIVINALKDAVKRGVQVFLLVDAFGSNDLRPSAIKEMEDSGIQFRKFSPLFNKYRIRFGRRLHHKILVGDAEHALIGGINVEDKYHIDGPETPWLDYAVDIKGAVCIQIATICETLWKGKALRSVRKKLTYVHHAAFSSKVIPVKISQNDWLHGKDKISKSLRSSLRHAHVSATFMASYFLPGHTARRLFRKASARNVKIRVIVPGISDVQLAKRATMYLYNWMLRNNIEIYEWNKTILHGKVNLIDDKWASIGSYNINHLSHYSSIETNIEVFDSAFCRTVKDELNSIISQCHKVTHSEHILRMNTWQKFLCWCAFQFTRFLFWFEFKVLSKE